jgi:flagellar basal body-associated protein FliL
MKKLIKAILVVAILNLLAVLVGAGWLFSSGRISKDRVMSMSALFTEPVAIEEANIKAEEAQLERELAEQEKPIPELALNSAERNMVRVEMTQIDRQRLDRMKREVEDLQATLRRERQIVEQDRIALESEKVEFDLMRDRLAGLEGGKQFKKSLSTLSGMKPKDAKTMLSTLLANEKSEEVVSYLSAMDDRIRTQIMSEFVKAGEEQLAADLLESLRLRGLETTTTPETNQ